MHEETEKDRSNRDYFFWVFVSLNFIWPIIRLFTGSFSWIDIAAAVFNLLLLPFFWIILFFEFILLVLPNEYFAVVAAVCLGLLTFWATYPFFVFLHGSQFIGDVDIFYSGYRDFLISAF
jgi:hypothetical protein